MVAEIASYICNLLQEEFFVQSEYKSVLKSAHFPLQHINEELSRSAAQNRFFLRRGT